MKHYLDYLGIDPGIKGGMGLICSDGSIIVKPFSTDNILNLCKDHQLAICCLEQVHSMPSQGVKSMFNFGKNFGYIKGVLEANNIPYQEVPPQTWKKEYSLNSEKEKSIEACKKLGV